MITIDYKDWLINQDRLPDKKSAEAKQFYDFHKQLCLDGFMMNGVFINPFLYWHLNIWNTEVDFIDEKGKIGQNYQNPSLRDNEWIVTNEIERAHQEKKGLLILGIRRFAKSVIEASYIAWGATFDENSQNVIAGLSGPDIKLITDKLDKGLNFIPNYWQWQRIEDNWSKQVTLGIKTKTGQRLPYSYIMIRNLEEGVKEESIAGTKPRKLIIDEVGKGNFLKALQAAIPGFTTPFGWGCSPILTGTGGDMKKFMDAKTLMFNVNSFNFLHYNNADDNKRVHGLFLGHKYRMEAKILSNLGDYLNSQEPELKKIKIQVSDIDLAEKVTDKNLEQLKKSSERVTYLKEKMYYPKKVDDIFLNEDTNIFDIEAARRQQIKLLNLERTGTPVILHLGENGIYHAFTDKLPISNFPSKPADDKNAPIVIFEFPISDAPYGLYVAGVDPYRQGKAAYSNSLGTVTIYKRMHSLFGEKYQDMVVATYAARPDKKEDWEKQARLLIKFYNARTLCENDDISFIDYMKAQGDAHYLEKQPEWLKEIIPNSTISREYGISRSAEKVINHLHSGAKKYTEEIVHQEQDKEGNVTKIVTGMNKILDPMFLEEIIQFNDEGNFDRLISFELAIAQAARMDPIYGAVKQQSDPRVEALYKKNKEKKSTLFPESRGVFSKRKRKLFV